MNRSWLVVPLALPLSLTIWKLWGGAIDEAQARAG